jgi:hypothetical protein
MTTQEFLKKIPKKIRIGALGCCRPLSELVLDPKVWKAVITILLKETNIKTPHDEKYIEQIHKDKMHQMIDHLCDGGTIETYLKTL